MLRKQIYYRNSDEHKQYFEVPPTTVACYQNVCLVLAVPASLLPTETKFQILAFTKTMSPF